MITRCDHCGSKFEVSAELVNSSNPGVRCGECLSLFDARANLFNEVEHRKTAATLKPVQKRRPAVKEVEAIDADILEAADTVAVEHIYTSAGVKSRALNDEQNFSGESSRYEAEHADIDQRYPQSDLDHSAGHRPEYQPEYKPEYQPNYRPEQPRAYGADNQYPDDIEFVRTLATESELPGRTNISDRVVDNQLAGGTANHSNANESAHRSDKRSSPFDQSEKIANREPATRDLASRDPASREFLNRERDDDTANRKRQALRDQEQRALRIEPERDFESLSSIDIALDQSRLDESREEEIARRSMGRQSPINDSDLARDTRVVNRGDTHFIPDDVLNRPAVIRDNGRRAEEATRFKADTPDFDISLDDDRLDTEVPNSRELPGRERPQQTNRDTLPLVKSGSVVDQYAQQEQSSDSNATELESFNYDATNNDTGDHGNKLHRGGQVEGLYDEAVDAAPQHKSKRDRHSSEFQGARQEGADSYIANRDERTPSNETSAQEMRRYQRYHPPVEVEQLEVEHHEVVQVDNDLTVQGSTSTIAPKRSSAGALFWMAGLILAIGLLLFAARSLIANMNLPEPIVTAFCQVTGCVPDQAKKNVDQLQIMRKRLYPHPEIENAIVISIDVVNNSIYKQPLPILGVSLLNEADEIIAERDFSSADYEVVDGSQSGNLMPEEPTRLKIEVVDTGLAAADVELEFK